MINNIFLLKFDEWIIDVLFFELQQRNWLDVLYVLFNADEVRIEVDV